MVRSALFLALFACALSAQTKKILISNNDPETVKELLAVTTKARLVPVNEKNIMQEIVDADACVCEIRPEQVRAGKNLKWVQSFSAA